MATYLPSPLHRLCILSSTLGPLGSSMLVCLTFVFFSYSGKATWLQSHPQPLTLPRTPARVTSSWHRLVCCSWSGGLKCIRLSDTPWFCQSLGCQVTPQTQWQLINISSSRHPPPPQTSQSSLTTTTTNQSLSPSSCCQGCVCPSRCPRTGSRPLLSSQLVKRRGHHSLHTRRGHSSYKALRFM